MCAGNIESGQIEGILRVYIPQLLYLFGMEGGPEGTSLLDSSVEESVAFEVKGMV